MIKIGIVTAIQKTSDQKIWCNGINQHAFFLIDLFKLSKNKYKVSIFNIYDISLCYEGYNIEKFLPNGLNVDIMINIAGLLSINQLDLCRKNGIKTVMYKCGNDYMIDIENTLFKDYQSNLNFDRHKFDECWYVPQNHECNEWYYKIIFEEKSFPVPFIWTPKFLEKEYELLKNHTKTYSNKNIAIMEPNFSVYKYCMYPILITEQEYKKDKNKECINHVYVFNSDQLKNKNIFSSKIKKLKLFEDKKITFERRLKTPAVLCKHADIVISHQLLNNLNYLYLDVAYLGYPIIHNAKLCKNIGYYYNDFDVKEGANILEDVIKNHDDNKQEYLQHNRREINKYLITNPDIIKCYDNLILGVLKGTNTNLKYNFDTNLFDNCVDVEEELQEIISIKSTKSIEMSKNIIKNKETTIPKIVWQTYDDKNSIPQKVFDNIKKYCKGYTHHIYDDSQCKKILSIFGQKYVNAFDNLKLGCHKADLWRYACMYLMGGVYLDIKIELLKDLDEILKNNDHLYICICQYGIFNGIIATPPKNDIFLSLMDTMVQFSETNQKMYFVTVMDFYNEISERMKKSTNPCTPCVCPGLYEHLKLTIFYENIIRNSSNKEERDRYGLVCRGHSYNGEQIFNTRYNDFPWKKSSNLLIPEHKIYSVNDMKYLSYLAHRKNTFEKSYKLLMDIIKNKSPVNIVELGTTRSFCSWRIEEDKKYWDPNNIEKWPWSDGMFTKLFADNLENFDYNLYSVDPCPKANSVVKHIIGDNDKINIVQDYSTDFLKKINFKIDFLYMDHMESSKEACELHLKDAKFIVENDLMSEHGIILIDDTPKGKGYNSKGLLSIPYLNKHGYKTIMHEYQTLLIKDSSK